MHSIEGVQMGGCPSGGWAAYQTGNGTVVGGVYDGQAGSGTGSSAGAGQMVCKFGARQTVRSSRAGLSMLSGGDGSVNSGRPSASISGGVISVTICSGHIWSACCYGPEEGGNGSDDSDGG